MITATLLGRLQTKVITYPLLGGLTLLFAWVGGDRYFWVFAIAMIIGLILETFWGLIVWYQPGWLAFLFGLVEFLAIMTCAVYFRVPLSFVDAVVYYVVTWIVIQLFIIYLLPVFRMCWVEYGGELW